MRVFVYEHLTATGLGREPGSPEQGMFLEGAAMLEAVSRDLARARDVQVTVFPEGGVPLEAALSAQVGPGNSDWFVVLIAPETDGVLAGFAGAVVRAGGRLLGPSVDAIRLTSDKFALAEHWREQGVPTPATTDQEPTVCTAFPVVWKPRDGAGAADTFLIRDRFELARARAGRDPIRHMILQEFIPGRAASVAFLCGPRGHVPLPPTFQLQSTDGRFKYRGGELPIPAEFAARAVSLGRRALGCVTGLLGYVGVDLVLGDAADGSGDRAIEINPRLTTSYIGLRALADFNLAEALLEVARGEPLRELRWRSGTIRFGTDGAVSGARGSHSPPSFLF
jgi:predicted ATP-grasp superfamily ATP-dependent carboligase